MPIIAIANQKGGVGKSVIALNLAPALAANGDTVLVVDLDPQGHATEGAGRKELYTREGTSLLQGLTQGASIDGLVFEVSQERFFLLPSNYQMILAEQALFQVRGREYKLANLLAGVKESFDWILIDCPPNLGVLTDNAIAAARRLIVPIQAEQTSVRALELLVDQIQSIEEELRFTVEILAIVPNLVQDSRLARRILSDVRTSLPNVVDFEIPKRVLFQEAYEAGCSIFRFEDKARQKDIQELRALYMRLADLVREKVKHADGK